jgi:hypothetical protein
VDSPFAEKEKGEKGKKGVNEKGIDEAERTIARATFGGEGQSPLPESEVEAEAMTTSSDFDLSDILESEPELTSSDSSDFDPQKYRSQSQLHWHQWSQIYRSWSQLHRVKLPVIPKA